MKNAIKSLLVGGLFGIAADFVRRRVARYAGLPSFELILGLEDSNKDVYDKARELATLYKRLYAKLGREESGSTQHSRSDGLLELSFAMAIQTIGVKRIDNFINGINKKYAENEREADEKKLTFLSRLLQFSVSPPSIRNEFRRSRANAIIRALPYVFRTLLNTGIFLAVDRFFFHPSIEKSPSIPSVNRSEVQEISRTFAYLSPVEEELRKGQISPVLASLGLAAAPEASKILYNKGVGFFRALTRGDTTSESGVGNVIGVHDHQDFKNNPLYDSGALSEAINTAKIKSGPDNVSDDLEQVEIRLREIYKDKNVTPTIDRTYLDIISMMGGVSKQAIRRIAQLITYSVEPPQQAAAPSP